MKGFNKVTLMTAGLAIAMAGTTMAAFPRYDADPNNKEYLQVNIEGTLYTDDVENVEDALENNLARAQHLADWSTIGGDSWMNLKWSNALERIAEVRAAEVAVRLPEYKHTEGSEAHYWWQENASGKITDVYEGKWIYGDVDGNIARPSGETLNRMVVNDANGARHSEYELVMSGFGTDISAALSDERVGQLLAGIDYYRPILNIGAAAFAPSDGGSFVVLELNLLDHEEKKITLTPSEYKNAWANHYDWVYDQETGKVTLVKFEDTNEYDAYLTDAQKADLAAGKAVEIKKTVYDTAWADEYKHEDAGHLVQDVTVKRGNIARLDVYKKGGDKTPDVTTAAKKYYTELQKGEKIELGVTATLKNIHQPNEQQTGFNTSRKYDVTDFATWTFVGGATTIATPSTATAAKNGITTYTVSLGDRTARAIQTREGVITVYGYEKAAPEPDDSLKNGQKFTATYQDTAIVYQVVDLAKKEAKVYKVANKDAAAVAIPASVEYVDEDMNVRFKVTAINGNAFKGMKNLETVSIGKNVTTIGRAAFWRDSKLATVIFNGSKTTNIAKNAFGKIAKDAVFTVKNDAEAKAVKAAVGFVSTQTVEQ